MRQKLTKFSILIIFLQLLNVNSQNATTCVELYQNKTIDTPCTDNTTCCYLNYDYFDKLFTKCIVKMNSTDNICDNISDAIGSFYGSVIACDCFSNWIINAFSVHKVIYGIIFILFVIY